MVVQGRAMGKRGICRGAADMGEKLFHQENLRMEAVVEAHIYSRVSSRSEQRLDVGPLSYMVCPSRQGHLGSDDHTGTMIRCGHVRQSIF